MLTKLPGKQLAFPFAPHEKLTLKQNSSYQDRLAALLSTDLSFHGQDNNSTSHNFHAFPAKFPPQLPRLFIEYLTQPGDIVLDPMLGSGTTILEAFLLDRQPIGFDIDSLAISLAETKTTLLSSHELGNMAHNIISSARQGITHTPAEYRQLLAERWDDKTREFVDYWFQAETQLELIALLSEIERIEDTAVRAFFLISFSAIIITKTGQWQFAVQGNIAAFVQYKHIAELSELIKNSREQQTALGDYVVKPDIIISRLPVEDSEIDQEQVIVSPDQHPFFTPIRGRNSQTPILHASISCKLTLRSDRSQNARTESLNLIRNRKGHTPHIAVVTAEPMPTRIASLALGTGDLDCVYHFALHELMAAVHDLQDEAAADSLNIMVDGGRLRDIADLPFDLVA